MNTESTRVTPGQWIAIALIAATTCITIAAWVRAFRAEWDLQRELATTYAQPSPWFEACVAAGNAAERDAQTAAEPTGQPVASGHPLAAPSP
jgi:hypothetical protein